MLRIVLPLALLAGLASPALSQSALTPRLPAALIHGNYCGPGNNAPLPPIDALDLACAHHDACTPTRGLPTPACNARLQREAEAVSRDPRQPDDLRALAGFIAAGATLLPSDLRGIGGRPVASSAYAPASPVFQIPDPPAPVLSDDGDDEE